MQAEYSDGFADQNTSSVHDAGVHVHLSSKNLRHREAKCIGRTSEIGPARRVEGKNRSYL